MKILRYAACLVLATGTLFSSPLLSAEEMSQANQITADAIRGHVYFLASDALEGRYVGSPGYEVAARYGESQFRAAGLAPALQNDGVRSYLQEVPVLKRTTTAGISLTVTNGNVSSKFAEGEDFTWFQGEMFPWEDRNLGVVYLGYGISEPDHGWDDLAGVDVRGRVVLIKMGAPMRDGVPLLPEQVHSRYAPPSAVFRKMATMLFAGAAGIFIIPDEMILGAWDTLSSKAPIPQFEYDNRREGAVHITLLCPVKPAVVDAIFAGRQLPRGMGGPGDEGDRSYELQGVTLTFTGGFSEERIPTWNVVGVVEGADSRLNGEYVAVTAHLDSTAPREEGEINNGADDNASGAAGLMEVAKAVAKDPPRRSVIFVLVSGEEAACIGARHFVSACPVPLDKIVADVNLDMIGRTDADSRADRSHYAIDSEKITPEFTALIKQVNARTVGWPMKYECTTGNSDNLMFHAVGIPGVNFYSGHHEDVNLPTDDPDKIDYEKAEKISRLVYELTMELGNREDLW
jgi:hypothetical protein